MDLGVVSNRKNVATELMLPVKMLEYVAMNIPVVAPRLKTIQHYFNDKMVGFFEPDNVDSLASVIFELYNDRSKRKEQAQEAKSFTEKYSWTKYQNNLTGLYNEL
jgi:glycosyltransferase involved in cell wall biosynthesis